MAGGQGGTLGIVLAGGRGERAKPITLESADYIRSKALIPLAGRSLIEWVVDLCREQGIRQFYVIAQGLENRSQIKSVLGHGERFGVDVRYSRPTFDRYNVGSGAATLHNLDFWDLTERALVLPVDSVFGFDLADFVRTHETADATVTVAAVARTAEEVAGKYGTMVSGRRGLVRTFVEKPPLERLHELFPAVREDPTATVPTNAGMYLVDCRRLRAAARHPDLMRLSHQRLDWGRDLLSWLVEHGDTVAVHQIERLGDLGNVRDYLSTLIDVLAGDYAQLSALMGEPFDTGRRWIHETSLGTRDDTMGTTLAQKIADGSVVVGPGVRIGRHVTIGSDVRLEYTDVGDGADLREGVTISRSAIGEGAIVGPYAEIADAYVGPLTEIRSQPNQRVSLVDYSAVGDGVHIWPGSRLSGVSVYPRLTVPGQADVPAGTQLTSSDDILRWVS